MVRAGFGLTPIVVLPEGATLPLDFELGATFAVGDASTLRLARAGAWTTSRTV